MDSGVTHDERDGFYPAAASAKGVQQADKQHRTFNVGTPT